MKIDTNQATAISPSRFGVPACGGHSETAFGGRMSTSIVRGREFAAWADLGLAVAYVPGTTAWSPPSS